MHLGGRLRFRLHDHKRLLLTLFAEVDLDRRSSIGSSNERAGQRLWFVDVAEGRVVHRWECLQIRSINVADVQRSLASGELGSSYMEVGSKEEDITGCVVTVGQPLPEDLLDLVDEVGVTAGPLRGVGKDLTIEHTVGMNERKRSDADALSARAW